MQIRLSPGVSGLAPSPRSLEISSHPIDGHEAEVCHLKARVLLMFAPCCALMPGR